jgi:hypothetical protein
MNDTPVVTTHRQTTPLHLALLPLALSQALGTEVARVRERLAELAASGGAGKKPSTRADRVAESSVLNAGQSVNDRDGWGHVPGIAVNNK